VIGVNCLTMKEKKKIFAISGSTRQGSVNHSLLTAIAGQDHR
jgi:hypothetical protein